MLPVSALIEGDEKALQAELTATRDQYADVRDQNAQDRVRARLVSARVLMARIMQALEKDIASGIRRMNRTERGREFYCLLDYASGSASQLLLDQAIADISRSVQPRWPKTLIGDSRVTKEDAQGYTVVFAAPCALAKWLGFEDGLAMRIEHGKITRLEPVDTRSINAPTLFEVPELDVQLTHGAWTMIEGPPQAALMLALLHHGPGMRTALVGRSHADLIDRMSEGKGPIVELDFPPGLGEHGEDADVQKFGELIEQLNDQFILPAQLLILNQMNVDTRVLSAWTPVIREMGLHVVVICSSKMRTAMRYYASRSLTVKADAGALEVYVLKDKLLSDKERSIRIEPSQMRGAYFDDDGELAVGRSR
jgi:hypothetical protein